MTQPELFTATCTHPTLRQVDSARLRCADCGAWISSGYVAEQRKREGIERVLENEDDEWKTRALACAYRVARHNAEFTVNELRTAWMNEGLGSPHHDNVIGAMFQTIKKAGIATPTNRMDRATHADGHGRAVRIWRSNLV